MNPDDLESVLIQCMLDRQPAASQVSAELRNRLWRKVHDAGWQPAADARQERQPAASDHALLRGFLAGNSGAFDELVNRHLGSLVGYARRSLPLADAEDVAQEAFLVLLQKAEQVKPDARLRSYLFGILRLEIRKHLARKSRLEIPHETLPDDADTQADLDQLVEQMTDEQRRRQVVSALEARCNPLEQDVLLLALRGHDGPAIAQELEITSNYVRQLKHRAIHKIRAHLAGNPP